MYLRLSASQIGDVIELEPARVNILLDDEEEFYLMHDDGDNDILMHDDNEEDLILTQ